MRKLATVIIAVLMTLIASPSFNAEAAEQYTQCGYKKFAGAPWASDYLYKKFPGHVTCPADIAVTVGYYKLISQRHYN
ncbi:hypothetical protein [Pseudoalteromonas luteoviolacea]|uniref:Uncharacterized protein n=1 Tax=Pseudoalteromonas luteoviolacea S4054 TaxID=1129367 RepID=A0A0F6A7L7_9GAMM|nr:hypothetical protein [Pseudoalteromonas luteoviolacea]AOT10405.1 hypothetical protein S4054249_21270 [Pseudoalteromonas luteoviolacea]AOT15525.1 hypothetical protein S40542_22320 [Pseudoalteromonas luteoviolacea]AOT20224.1 hypothetical protein S4054_21185 [Pseudoalteromonas luteoviolacea]KKE82170.1 hypothetical protein N479_19395 [Pseudoalteromonas luteoviolacea S4054]KZN69692.1 hypothetical protein N481_21830 [Pseudoalteromonas luteoviolacea S4047-1]